MGQPKITKSGDKYLVEYTVLAADINNPNLIQGILTNVQRQNAQNMDNELNAEAADTEIARLTALKADRIVIPIQHVSI